MRQALEAALTQLALCCLMSLGFALLFNQKKERWGYTALGGGLTWLLYLLTQRVGGGVFACSLLAASLGTAYAEHLAYRLRAPTTTFLMPTLVPLIPGGSLYRTMYALLMGDREACSGYLRGTLSTAMGIAVGITGVLFAARSLRKLGKR